MCFYDLSCGEQWATDNTEKMFSCIIRLTEGHVQISNSSFCCLGFHSLTQEIGYNQMVHPCVICCGLNHEYLLKAWPYFPNSVASGTCFKNAYHGGVMLEEMSNRFDDFIIYDVSSKYIRESR